MTTASAGGRRRALASRTRLQARQPRPRRRDLIAPPSISSADKSEVTDLVGPSYSMRHVAEKLGAALGKTLQIVDIPQPGRIPTPTRTGAVAWAAEIYAEMYG